MVWDESKIFQILPFYDSYIGVPKIKKLNNIKLLKELLFYDELTIVKNKTAFSGYAQSYKIEIIDKKDVIAQLKSSEISIEHLFKDLLVEMKGFKYQITLTKTVTVEKYYLNQCFNEIILIFI